ncbi:MAG TPA: endolytic transglycosylase MltG [Micropepsaceae bacterium]|nr:endolytic transglycosylase MltG [Micropepsaceae bacterium]
MRAFFTSFIVLIVLAVAAIAGGAWWENNYFVQEGPAAAQTVVVITPGSGLNRIAATLAQAGVIENGLLFRAGVMRRGRTAQLKAGEYAFPPHASEAQVVDMLVTHKTLEHRLTIPEGLTSDAAVALVKADPTLTGDVPVVPEGSLLPETYLFERGTTRAELLARMHKAQEALLAQVWPKRKEGLPFASQEDALKLASIVEKETAIPSERPRIAAVFINRLQNGMKLESDPTIIYGLTKGVPLGHPLRQSELATPNPYSTYQIAGLPPTPISNPGRDAIQAVLNPSDSQELYFVANGTGGHVFAKTAAEHQRNVAQWRKIEQQPSAVELRPTP